MERLLAHWYAISKHQHSGINLIKFLAEGDNGPILSLDKVQVAPAELEDSQPQVKRSLRGNKYWNGRRATTFVH
ncbi:hypothetical protein ACFX12_027556 [Malus domestica]